MEEVTIQPPQPWFCPLVWFVFDDSTGGFEIPRASWLVFLNQSAVVITGNLVDRNLRLSLASSSVSGPGVCQEIITRSIDPKSREVGGKSF